MGKVIERADGKRVFEVTVHEDSLQAVKLKYNRLVNEIESLPRGLPEKGNMIHTAHKLGIFLEEMLGYAGGELVWRQVRTGAVDGQG